MSGEPKCGGRSARGDCPAPVMYAVGRAAGREPDGTPKTQTRHRCGRHLSWLVGYMTGIGHSLTVTRLR